MVLCRADAQLSCGCPDLAEQTAEQAAQETLNQPQHRAEQTQNRIKQTTEQITKTEHVHLLALSFPLSGWSRTGVHADNPTPRILIIPAPQGQRLL